MCGLFHPPNSEEWNHQRWDCYFGNKNPEWGNLGPTGDASLDIDDTNGAGPENINIEQPEFTDELRRGYLVGVHYYNSASLFLGEFGSSEVLVRIHLMGALAGSFEQTLRQTDNFWRIAVINWTRTGSSIENVERFYQVMP